RPRLGCGRIRLGARVLRVAAARRRRRARRQPAGRAAADGGRPAAGARGGEDGFVPRSAASAARAVRGAGRRPGSRIAGAMITLYDADRCPYCARVRIVLAEKGLGYETVAIDLSDRPAWLYEKNPLGKVPVLEEDTLCLPESTVIMEYLEERYPEPPLLPDDPAERALVRLQVERFDHNLGDAYYAFRRGEEGSAERLAHCLSLLGRGATASPRSPTCRGSSGCATCSASTCRRTPSSPSASSASPSGRLSPPRWTSSPACRDERAAARRRRGLACRPSGRGGPPARRRARSERARAPASA